MKIGDTVELTVEHGKTKDVVISDITYFLWFKRYTVHWTVEDTINCWGTIDPKLLKPKENK